MSNETRVGLFGGSFNPIHVGHLMMAENVREQLELERIVFLPAGSPPHKTGQRLASFQARMAMVELAIAENSAFACGDLDADHVEPSFTWRLLERFREWNPDTALWFVMGGDSLNDFHLWARPERILELARLAVVERPGFSHGSDEMNSVPGLEERVDFVQAPLCSVSSTGIRSRLEAQSTVRYLIPEAVRSYIEDNALYR